MVQGPHPKRSGTILLEVDEPQFNHDSGQVAFGPDDRFALDRAFLHPPAVAVGIIMGEDSVNHKRPPRVELV